MKFKLSLGRNTSNIDYTNLIITERLHLKDVASFLSGMSRPEIALQQKSNEYERKRKTVR